MTAPAQSVLGDSAGGNVALALTVPADRHCSAVFADLTGLPPLLIQVG
jgi:hypothetical protein